MVETFSLAVTLCKIGCDLSDDVVDRLLSGLKAGIRDANDKCEVEKGDLEALANFSGNFGTGSSDPWHEAMEMATHNCNKALGRWVPEDGVPTCDVSCPKCESHATYIKGVEHCAVLGNVVCAKCGTFAVTSLPQTPTNRGL